MALSWFQRLLKKSRPLSPSARLHTLTLEALEDRTVLSFLPAATSPVGVLPRAVTVADFNNDGKPDLAVVNQGPSSTPTSQGSLSVLLGNGNGSFQPAVTTAVLNSGQATGIAVSAAVGDLNGDGLPDVALNTAGPAGPAVEVLLGRGDGSFQPNHLILGVGQTPLSVAVGDFDGNGALDLVTANSNGTLSLLLGNGGGSFRPRIDLTVGGAPRSVAVGDFNGDGRLDVVTAQQLSDTVSVLLGNGNGTFARPLVFTASGVNFTPESMVVGDVNGDGKLDLAIKSVSVLDSDAFQVGVLLGNGDGTFRAPLLAPAQPDGSGDLALGDFNNDGRMDVAVADQLVAPTGGLSVFFGNGDGTFQPNLRLDLLTGGNDPFGVAAADLNGDGRVDLVAANTSSNSVGVLLNNSTGTTATKTFSTLTPSTATAVFGQPLTLTALVTSAAGVPTGTVTFRDGTTVLGTVQVNAAGRATLAVSLGVGNHELISSFVGAGNFADSTGIADTTVNRAATTIALTSSVNPAAPGQAVTFTATVTAVAPGAGTPTGTVTFRDGLNVVLGTVAVGARGTATFTTSFAAAGGHAIDVAYNGDGNFVFSRQFLTEQVNAPATTGLQQGGFESPNVGAGTFAYDPTGSAWAFSGNAGVAGNGSGFTSGNPNAPAGSQVAFLQRTGSFSQSVTLAAGTYQLTFQAAQRANFQASRQDFRVLVDGQVVGTFTPASTAYAGFTTAAFTVGAGAHTVTFQGLDTAGGDNTAFIDNVQLNPAAPATTGLQQGGFESPNVGAGTFAYDPTGSAWAFSGNAGVAGNGSGFTSGNPNAPQGTQVGFLQQTGSFSQAVNLAAGTYNLTFSAAQRGNHQASSQTLQVLVDGIAVGTFTPAGTAYSTFTTSNFTVAAGAHTIRFVGLNPRGGDNTAFIDNVQLNAGL